MAHHHLAIAVVFIVAGHMYRTNFGIGHNMKEILDAHRPPGGRLGAGFLMVGAFAHGAIFFVRDYDPELNKNNVLAQYIQAASGKAVYQFNVLLASSTSPATAAGNQVWLPGALDARGSKLMPDKKDFGYSFPCDGPGRGGTCDISAWDAFYLAMFWMLNTIGWVTFYWHWKHMTIWGGNPGQFDESSNYIMVWAHERTPLANLIRWRDKPVALSIVQARLVGLVHFSVGYILTYAAFVIASTSGKFA
eukprot:scaffold15032_cov1338-Alexandrium_tamarense.AAC.2